MDRIQIKELAKRQISNNIGIIILMYLAIYAIVILSSYIAVPIAYALGVIMEISLFSVYLRLAGDNVPQFLDIFDIFNNAKLCGNGIILYILISIFTFLWSLLLFIPGIVKSLSYAMAPYILIENEYYMSPMDAIRESQRIMEGHKMELFVLLLSFIGWYLLGVITFGLVMFYADPYINMSLVNFYNEIKDTPEDVQSY